MQEFTKSLIASFDRISWCKNVGGFSNHVWLTCVGQNVNGGNADTLTFDLYLNSYGPSDLDDIISGHEYDQFRILDALTPNGSIIPIQPY